MSSSSPTLLREPGDRRTVVFVSLYFVTLVLAFGMPQLTLAGGVGMAVLLCVLAFICAVITHNTVHHPIFRSKRLNKAFQVVLTLAYGHPVSAYVPGHNLSHHMHTQTARDSIRTTKLRFRWNLLNQLLFLPMCAPSIMKGEREYLRHMKDERPAWYKQWRVEMVLLTVTTVSLFVLDWQRALAFWMLPHLYAAWGIVGINFMQHDGCDEDHPYNHSRNFTGAFTNWLLFNNGYHGIHHDKPNLHWSRLPEVHAREISPHIHPALEQESLLRYAFQAFVWPGRRLRYDGTPVQLPDPVEDEPWIKPGDDRQTSLQLGAGG